MKKTKKPRARRSAYSLSPQTVSRHFWYYEEPKGLCCIFQPRDKNSNLLFAWPAFYIPWRLVEASMRRRSETKKRRKPRADA